MAGIGLRITQRTKGLTWGLQIQGCNPAKSELFEMLFLKVSFSNKIPRML